MSESTNYLALGEHTAYTAQARDAARRRHSALYAAAILLDKASSEPERPLRSFCVGDLLDIACAADREMCAAIKRANQAAALCGKAPITVRATAAASQLD